jgi:RNA ligase
MTNGVPTFEELDARVAEKLVSRVDQGPISIYNYTEKCVYERAWDDVTRRARGLILNRETGEVVARAFDKFFNHGESDAQVPDGIPEAVTIKHDGSLGILYRHEGRIRWSTRGSFYSPQAAIAQRIWDERYTHLNIPDEFTVLVEIIDTGTYNIIRYPFSDLVVLGIRNRLTGADLPYEVVAEWAGAWGMPVTERVGGTLSDIVARASKMDHTEEGFVLRWGDHRVKVKSNEYLRVARLIQGLTDRTVADIWYAQRTDLLAPLPEEHRDYAATSMCDLDTELHTVAVELDALMAQHEGIVERKAFVQAVGPGHALFSAAMRRFRGEAPDLRMLVYRARFEGNPRPVGVALAA